VQYITCNNVCVFIVSNYNIHYIKIVVAQYCSHLPSLDVIIFIMIVQYKIPAWQCTILVDIIFRFRLAMHKFINSLALL